MTWWRRPLYEERRARGAATGASEHESGRRVLRRAHKEKKSQARAGREGALASLGPTRYNRPRPAPTHLADRLAPPLSHPCARARGLVPALQTRTFPAPFLARAGAPPHKTHHSLPHPPSSPHLCMPPGRGGGGGRRRGGVGGGLTGLLPSGRGRPSGGGKGGGASSAGRSGLAVPKPVNLPSLKKVRRGG